MGARAVHFALGDKEVRLLLQARGTDALQNLLEEIEESWDEAWLCETDKAWDAIHRCLSDGTLNVARSPSALHKAILGGDDLFNGDSEDVARLVRADEVPAVASALEGVTKEWLRKRFSSLLMSGYEGPADEDDFEYTWENLQSLAQLFRKAASERRAVLCSVWL